MSSDRTMASGTKRTPPVEDLLDRYGCGPIGFAGDRNALYERHLTFDNVVDSQAAGPRERYEAIARSVRDILSQRWLRTEQTYARENAKRVYYLSMEFLIGRSLASNITNLLLDPVAKRVVADKSLDWLAILEEEPDAGLGNGGLGRLAACFLDSMATMQLPAMGYGLRYQVPASSSKAFGAGGRKSSPTTGCGVPIRGRSHGRKSRWRSSSVL